MKEILSRAYEEAKKLLSDNRDILDKIAAYLIEKETITGSEFMSILEKCRKEREEAKAAEGEGSPKDEEPARLKTSEGDKPA